MNRLVLATRNPGKIVGLDRILRGAGLGVELVGTDAFPGLADVPETSATFAANALLKARAVAEDEFALDRCADRFESILRAAGRAHR